MTPTFLVVPVHDGQREHAAVAMHSEGNLDEGGQVVEEKQGRPTFVYTSYQQVHKLWSLKQHILVGSTLVASINTSMYTCDQHRNMFK